MAVTGQDPATTSWAVASHNPCRVGLPPPGCAAQRLGGARRRSCDGLDGDERLIRPDGHMAGGKPYTDRLPAEVERDDHGYRYLREWLVGKRALRPTTRRSY